MPFVIDRIIACFLRFITYKIVFILGKCRDIIVLMFSFSSAKNVLTFLSRYRKLVLLVIFILVLLIYFSPSIFNLRKTPLRTNRLDRCIEDKLQYYSKAAGLYDAIINHKPLQLGETYYHPFIGNGKFGVSVTDGGYLYLKHQRSLSVPVPVSPVLSLYMEGYETKVAHAMDFREGGVSKVQCFKQNYNDLEFPLHVAEGTLLSLCISVATQAYAHRARPSILIQEAKIYNPTAGDVHLDMDLGSSASWDGKTVKKLNFKTPTGDPLEFSLMTGTVPVPNDAEKKVFVVAVASPKVPSSFVIKTGKTERFFLITAVDYSDPVLPAEVEKTKTAVEAKVSADLREAIRADAKVLRKEHTAVWAKLWASGFDISLSKAPGALNGDKINATMYYVVSSTSSPLNEIGIPQEKLTLMEKYLHMPDKCYGGHHTLQASTLWADLDTVDSISSVVKTWMITLEAHGCAHMLKAGADGALQAMILSFGGMKFSNDHLEFNTMPKDLHRDYMFRRINYGSNTHLNISVKVGEDNKAMIYTALDRNDKPYYACDAGCLDPPVKLSKSLSSFPVKQTDPITAILYITSDKVHMEELKHAIHVKEIVEAPAHEHHVLALHRHGHEYGGLPMLFWAAIAFLVIIFHLFLFKIIYTEYCLGEVPNYPRAKYNL
ncbi:uncharacterized protein KIAA2013 homolog isoform X2 [Lineus longissimus]|uniref:uncharacterized protein KIAA2013 homolog isoform X2 n=1 Tax=Lineus longissimus TaxID=88925 RepID=UPI002B4EBB8C